MSLVFFYSGYKGGLTTRVEVASVGRLRRHRAVAAASLVALSVALGAVGPLRRYGATVQTDLFYSDFLVGDSHIFR